MGSGEERIRQYREKIGQLRDQVAAQTAELAELAERLREELSSCEKEYLRQTGRTDLPSLIANFERARKANATLRGSVRRGR